MIKIIDDCDHAVQDLSSSLTYSLIDMKSYPEAKESLQIKAILLGLQTLSESKDAGDRNLGDTINRLLQKSWDFLKQDKETQKEAIIYLTHDSEDCV